jgi:hypothetical protein
MFYHLEKPQASHGAGQVRRLPLYVITARDAADGFVVLRAPAGGVDPQWFTQRVPDRLRHGDDTRINVVEPAVIFAGELPPVEVCAYITHVHTPLKIKAAPGGAAIDFRKSFLLLRHGYDS